MFTRLFLLTLFVVLVCLFACTKEQSVPIHLKCSFSIENDDYTVPSKLIIENSTLGADEYKWSFDGGQPGVSTDKNPDVITYTNAGEYNVLFTASNQYGASRDTSIRIKLYDAVHLDFDIEVLESGYPPATIKIHNKCHGLSEFNWSLEGSDTPVMSGEQPQHATYLLPGEYSVKLTASNGVETHSLSKSFTVLENIKADFNWQVDFADDDYQAPVSIQLQNNSISAETYQWHFKNKCNELNDRMQLLMYVS